MISKYYDAVRLRDLREVVDYSAAKYGDKVIVREFNARHEIVGHTCRQLQSDVRALGAGLVAEGLLGRHLAVIGENAYSYVVAYLAVANWVGVIIPIDNQLSSEEVARQLQLCDAAAVFCSGAQARKVAEALPQCPDVKLVVGIGGPASAGSGSQPDSEPQQKPGDRFASVRSVSMDTLIANGQALLEAGAAAEPVPELDVNACCTIIFTSGTTGANKGVMLCHRNITAVLHSALSMFKHADTYFSLLPINHTVEMNLFILGSLCAGFTICFNDSLKNVKENFVRFKPDMTMMVPMLVDHLYKNIWKEAEKAGQATKLRLGIAASRLLRLVRIDIRDRLFAPILAGLGGRLKLIFCGGAPLSPKLVRGMEAFGISVFNGYGITECSPMVASNSPLSQVPGSVGAVAPDCTVRISDVQADGTGEIQVKGDNVMLGYYKDEAATRKSFTEDGWFRTGDLGRLDRKGNVYITGRAKNLIISANGKNVYPEELEDRLLNSIPYLREVVVFAPKDKRGEEHAISASAYLDPQFMLEMGRDKARELFKADVERVNRQLAKFKRISQVMIRETEFEKTTTKKIKRHAQHP